MNRTVGPTLTADFISDLRVGEAKEEIFDSLASSVACPDGRNLEK